MWERYYDSVTETLTDSSSLSSPEPIRLQQHENIQAVAADTQSDWADCKAEAVGEIKVRDYHNSLEITIATGTDSSSK